MQSSNVLREIIGQEAQLIISSIDKNIISYHWVHRLRSMPVSALQQRMAVFIRTEGSLSGSAPSREGDQWPPMAMASSLPLIPTKNWKRETDGYNRRATGQRYNGVEVWQVEKAQRWIKTEKNKRGQSKIKSKINQKYQGYYNNSWHQSQFFHMRSTQQWNRKTNIIVSSLWVSSFYSKWSFCTWPVFIL